MTDWKQVEEIFIMRCTSAYVTTETFVVFEERARLWRKSRL